MSAMEAFSGREGQKEGERRRIWGGENGPLSLPVETLYPFTIKITGSRILKNASSLLTGADSKSCPHRTTRGSRT